MSDTRIGPAPPAPSPEPQPRAIAVEALAQLVHLARSMVRDEETTRLARAQSKIEALLHAAQLALPRGDIECLPVYPLASRPYPPPWVRKPIQHHQPISPPRHPIPLTRKVQPHYSPANKNLNAATRLTQYLTALPNTDPTNPHTKTPPTHTNTHFTQTTPNPPTTLEPPNSPKSHPLPQQQPCTPQYAHSTINQ
uniref:Uncharacterized protein n=1 Tax=Magnetospirillum gryphiswaldense TaxID=55518 RepID=A4U407_9PROT|nr:hypothetical protein MGR_0312 [Magnetospirillum gryphiswaldense MSR-1]